MKLASLLIGLMWLVFLVYWLISAAGAKRTLRRRSSLVWEVGLRLLIVAVYVAMLKVPFLHKFVGVPRIASDPLLEGLGVALCFGGILFAVWARRHLGRNWGIPMSLKENPELVTTGPYRLVRHPIYSGLLLGLLGTVLVFGVYWLLVALIVGLYFLYSAKTEEKILEAEFPTKYPEYKKRTKRLIPYIL